MSIKKQKKNITTPAVILTNLYALYDAKVGFDLPFPSHSDETAIRQFENTIMDKTTQLSKIANDVELWKMGVFNGTTGEYADVKERLALGASYAVISRKN